MVKEICAAARYGKADDLWVITCFFNSNDYKTKQYNYNKFVELMEVSHLNYIVIECVFGEQAYFLPKAKSVHRVRSKDIIWQKERLLNIAMSKLPTQCKKVAWIDCDVLFDNPDWAKETSQKLKYHAVVQPFKQAIRLPRNCLTYFGKGLKYYSFAYMVERNPVTVSQGIFNLHGHTGFAWASHKNLIKKYGFYDASIGGSGDHMMAHSFVGDWDGACMKTMIGSNNKFYEHYSSWSRKIYDAVRSKVTYVDGTLLHLWHGDQVYRDYADRHRVIEHHKFDPYSDIAIGRNGCWRWNDRKSKLKKWAAEYFVSRREDG